MFKKYDRELYSYTIGLLLGGSMGWSLTSHYYNQKFCSLERCKYHPRK